MRARGVGSPSEGNQLFAVIENFRAGLQTYVYVLNFCVGLGGKALYCPLSVNTPKSYVMSHTRQNVN